MEILIAVLLVPIFAFVPMLLYALVIWWFDRYEKEPFVLLIAAFGWGAIPAIIFSLVAQLVLDLPISYLVDPEAANLVGVTVVAPITEELFKGGALLFLLLAEVINRLIVRYVPSILKGRWLRLSLKVLFPPFFRKEIDSPLDGIIYGAMVGFGFAAVENALYFGATLIESGAIGQLVLLAFLRAFVFGLNHALYTGLTGLGLALAYTSRNWLVRIGAPVAGLSLGMLVHAVHNGTVSIGAALCWPCVITFVSDYGGVLLLFVIVIWTTLRERMWIVDNLAQEVKRGALSQEDYEVVCSYLKRVATRTRALFRGDFKRWWRLGRYYRLATELAFNKHRLSQFPDEEDTQAEVDELRSQLIKLGRELQ